MLMVANNVYAQIVVQAVGSTVTCNVGGKVANVDPPKGGTDPNEIIKITAKASKSITIRCERAGTATVTWTYIS